MSWNKTQFKEAYNRASHKNAEQQGHQDYHDMYLGCYYDEIYDYWERKEYDDYQNPTMKDLMTGRLLTLLSKLKIRGCKDALDQLYW